MDSQGKYLGFPMVMTSTKDQIFVLIKDKVQKRIQSWKNKTLSTARKEVMIKAVTMALMSCFASSSQKNCVKTFVQLRQTTGGERKDGRIKYSGALGRR